MGFFAGLKLAREQRRTVSDTRAILGRHVQEYFSLPRLADHSEEWKNKIKADFAARTSAIMQAENPFLALRKEISSCALWYADNQVLATTAAIKAQSFYSDCPSQDRVPALGRYRRPGDPGHRASGRPIGSRGSPTVDRRPRGSIVREISATPASS
jgi:hypothetical protein